MAKLCKDMDFKTEDNAMQSLRFLSEFEDLLEESATSDDVAGFKSVACYRTGLDIASSHDDSEYRRDFDTAVQACMKKGKVRLAFKAFNDRLVRLTLWVGGQHGKPVQFHTGLGDNDIRLNKSSPAHMQSIIEAFPQTKIVLLHSSYPFTKEAGYLTAVYANVYLDFGEIFLFLSPDAQRTVVRELFDLCPTNKIMWSTDSAWFPESYYLASAQGREALYEVLADYVQRCEITETQAIDIAKRALFENANEIYGLKLIPSPPKASVYRPPPDKYTKPN